MSRAHGGWVWGAVLCVWPVKVYGKTSRLNIFWCPGPTGVGFGVPFFVSGLYKFMGKLADRIFFGVQGPRGLGLGCRSLCLAFINLWEN